MVQENGMMLEVLPLEAGGARLVRVYGQDPCVVLPGSVPAPAGGSWPITELGDYCFSEKPRSLPASDAVCRYQVDDTGAVRLSAAKVTKTPAGTGHPLPGGLYWEQQKNRGTGECGMVQENGMMLEVLPLEAGGARLVRVYGQDPCVVLPGSVPAPAGGSWPITELGDYCFSEKPRSLPASDAVCRYQVDDTGAVRLTRAFGQAVGGSARRYDFDFDAPAADPDDLHPVCGSFVEEVTLPDRLQVIGSCAFYNCRKLRLLTVGAEGLTLGSDVFLNCFALETIRVQAEADAATGLFALVNNITEAVRAEFRPAGAAAPLAALWYPAYWEDIDCLLYTSPSPRDISGSRMPSSA